EVLVVVGILAILAALVASAVFRVLESQKENLSEATVRTLAQELDRHWQAVVNQANKEVIPDWVKDFAGRAANAPNYEQRARVLWIKLRLKQEFPMNFAEAVKGPIDGNLPEFKALIAQGIQVPLSYVMPPLPSYVSTLAKLGITAATVNP